MGLKGKLTIETEIKGSAENYYKVMKAEAHRFSSISPDKVSSVELYEGDWHQHGAIKTWNYTINGKTESVKEKIAHNDENMTVTLTGVDGDPFKVLKGYKGIFEAIPGEKDRVRMTVEYEKLKETDPAPVHYFDFLIGIFVDDLDNYLTNQ